MSIVTAQKKKTSPLKGYVALIAANVCRRTEKKIKSAGKTHSALQRDVLLRPNRSQQN